MEIEFENYNILEDTTEQLQKPDLEKFQQDLEDMNKTFNSSN